MLFRAPQIVRNVHIRPKQILRHQRPFMTSQIHCSSVDPMEIDSSSDEERPTGSQSTFKILSYNLWFREDVVLQERMTAVGNIIQQEAFPEFLCFQEVTHQLLLQLLQHPFMENYFISHIPKTSYFTLLCLRKDLANNAFPNYSTHEFTGSQMGRGLSQVRCNVNGVPVLVSTTHLESPCGNNKFTEQRIMQLHESLELLSSTHEKNLVLAGDMNWIPEDPVMELPTDWNDAWLAAQPDDPGFTYDTNKNSLIQGLPYLPARLDRLLYKMKDFEIHWMKLIGTEAIEGVIAKIQSTGGRVFHKKAFPSDHFGILTEFKRKQ